MAVFENLVLFFVIWFITDFNFNTDANIKLQKFEQMPFILKNKTSMGHLKDL